MNGFRWFMLALSNSFKFSGRARRAEYAWFLLIMNIISVPIVLLSAEVGSWLNLLWFIIYLIPSISVTTRRLHDLGYSGWLQVPISLLEIYLLIRPTTESAAYGWLLMWVIVMFIWGYFSLKDGQRKDNDYGKDPKGVE